MSRLYDTIEPAVIDENILKQCVEEQGPSGEAGKISKAEGIDFKDVTELCLDFKSTFCFCFVFIITPFLLLHVMS